jgi:hypothetical protein
MRLFYLLIFTYYATAQISSDDYSYINFYKLNPSDATRLAIGNAGIANSDISQNIFINPAINPSDRSIIFSISTQSKTKIESSFGVQIQSNEPILNANIVFPIGDKFTLGAEYSNYGNFNLIFPTILFQDQEGDIVMIEPLYDFYLTQYKVVLAFQIDDHWSVGFGYSHMTDELNFDFEVFEKVSTDFTFGRYEFGSVYKYNETLTFGLNFRSGESIKHEESVIAYESELIFGGQNQYYHEIGLGIRYQWDIDAVVSADIINFIPIESKNKYKSVIPNYRIGVDLKQTEEFNLMFGVFSEYDSRDNSKNDWLEEDGYFTQHFITFGGRYILGDFLLSGAFITSELTSAERLAHSRYAFTAGYKF